ncbi:MAE_28990/MAE_18760 family HEPN-like nuclease [Gordonia sp. L191]|uniref:HEPN domain-containing protein n=1 Tax=Gordonia sp. L191 TaxID=2982699 RepID=UPI0024BFDA9E|nr:HEPN domain-containing protein [Gordonia sp. L191]WHU48104.1 MAE_28990/MAE_18760 family HEPN-like nuclease [Gordonia sp. L191]
MLPVYYELDEDLKLIRRYLDGITDVQTLDHRRFSYIACISSLYATFERFIEQLLFNFSTALLQYSDKLEEVQISRLQDRYTRHAAHLLGQQLGSGRFRDLTRNDVATSLASCLGKRGNAYQLRKEVISHHSANVRWPTIKEMFNWAIPDLTARVACADAVAAWSTAGAKVSESSLTAELEDLVERRNDLAHNGIPIEILSRDELLEKVEYIEAISLGLVATLSAQILDASSRHGDSIPIGTVTRRYINNRVALVDLTCRIECGDFVWTPVSASTARWGQVIELRVGENRSEAAEPGESASLHLDFAVPKKAMLYVWSTPNEDLVSPPDKIFGRMGRGSASGNESTG